MTRLPRLIVVLALVLGALVCLQVTASGARAECDGGNAFAWTVAHARSAVVGTIASVDTDLMGFARSVRVERAYGMTTGRLIVGEFWAGDPCSGGGDEPMVGAHVVILFGVPGPGPHALFYTIGKTVTPWQAAHIGPALPDTATSAVAEAPANVPAPAWPLPVAGAIGSVIALWRVRRGAAPRPRPRPRTPSA